MEAAASRLLSLGRMDRTMRFDPQDPDHGVLWISSVDSQDRAEIEAFLRDGTALTVAGHAFGAIVGSQFKSDEAFLTIRVPPCPQPDSTFRSPLASLLRRMRSFLSSETDYESGHRV